MESLLFAPLPLHPRWSTLVMGVAIVAVVGWRTRRPGAAIATGLAWLFAYEVLWQAGSGLAGHVRFWDLNWLYWLVISGGWLALAHVLGVRPRLGLLVASLLILGLWLALGFDANWPGRPVNWRNEALNETSKTALGLAYLLGALTPWNRKSTR